MEIVFFQPGLGGFQSAGSNGFPFGKLGKLPPRFVPVSVADVVVCWWRKVSKICQMYILPIYYIYIYISCLCILSFSFYVYFICILNLNVMKCSKRPPFVLGNVETKTKTIYYSYLPISMAPTRHAKQVPLLSRLRIMSSYLSRRNNSKNKLCNQTTSVDGSEIHPAPVGVYMFIPLSTRF